VINALQVGDDAEGGYLVPDEYEHKLIEALEEENIFRRLAHTIQTDSGERKIPVVASKGTANWIDEEGPYVDSDDNFTQITIGAHKLGTTIKVSEELLRDSVFNLEDYISREFARRIGRKEEEAFLSGNGANKPSGVLESAEITGFEPDIIHANDWQTALTVVFAKTLYAGKGYKTVFTVHNVEYQGRYGTELLHDCIGLEAKDNPLFSTSKDGAMLFSKDKKKLYSYPSATGDIILPNTITIIGNQAFTPSKVKTLTITSKEIRIQSEAFARCETLESVTVQGDVIAERDNFGYSFDTRIFTGCTNLKEINFEGSVSSIDQSFEGCKNLTRFSIPKGITHIAMETFTNCENITFDVSKNNNFITSEDGTKLMSADGKCLIFWTSASGDVIIPDGVEELYTEVFSTCKNPVTSITLPKSLKDMGGHYDPCALSYLWPNLKKINFAGTKEQWESILNNMNPFTRVDMQRIPTTYNYKK